MTSNRADWTFAGARLISSGEQEVAEDRTELSLEVALVRAVDTRADEVGRDEIRCELHPVEGAPQDRSGGLDRQRLGETRHAFDQHVPAGEQADEHPFQHLFLARNHAPDLEQRLFQLASDLVH